MSGLYGVCVETAKVTFIHPAWEYGFAETRDGELIHFWFSAHRTVVPGRHAPVFSSHATFEVDGQEILIPELAVDDRIVFVRSEEQSKGRAVTVLVWSHKLLWNLISEEMARRPIYMVFEERRFVDPNRRMALGDSITMRFIGYEDEINQLPNMWEEEGGLGPNWVGIGIFGEFELTRAWFILDPEDHESLIQIQDPRFASNSHPEAAEVAA